MIVKNKVFLLFIFLLVKVMFISAQQTLTLSFEARHYEGENVGLDSILIKNISRNCDTVLYAPDTVLLYNYFVSLEENKVSENFILQNYPNPAVNNLTNFNVNLYDEGNLLIELFDLLGRKVLSYSQKQNAGNYNFKLSLGSKGTFILKARYNNNYKSIKILNSLGSNSGAFSIEQSWFSPLSSRFKTHTQSGGFWYEPGDTLWYVGYAQTPHGVAGSDVLEDIPDIISYKRFEIVEGMPCQNVEAVKYGGQLYPTVELFGNCWFKENLDIGEMIYGDSNMTNNGIFEKYCYDNDTENCNEYGGLYQWNELMDYSEEEATQGICPSGWHIPTKDEYLTLVDDFDGEGCKERGNQHWQPGYNTNGTNVKGFTILGSGYRQNTTVFEQLKTIAVFHSSTKMTYDWVWHIGFVQNNQIYHGTTLKITGNSIRCIKD